MVPNNSPKNINNLYIPLSISNNVWTKAKNPYHISVEVDNNLIQAAIESMKKMVSS